MNNEITRSVNKIVQSFFTGKDYSSEDAQTWSESVSEEVAKALKGFDDKYKYCVVTIILQKADPGISLSSCCYWDNITDTSFALSYENNTMHGIVTCFSLLHSTLLNN
jgi:Tctex-1 family